MIILTSKQLVWLFIKTASNKLSVHFFSQFDPELDYIVNLSWFFKSFFFFFHPTEEPAGEQATNFAFVWQCILLSVAEDGDFRALGSRKGRSCRTERKRLETARRSRALPWPENRQTNATSPAPSCSTEPCSDPCPGYLCGSGERKWFICRLIKFFYFILLSLCSFQTNF